MGGIAVSKNEAKTRIPNFTIRPAEAGEVPLILQFILELAEYEGLAHEVEATEELLRKNLFGVKPSAEVVFGCFKGEPVSFALFFHNFSTFQGKPGLYLEDLYVRPELRGKGFGTAMLAYLANLALERKGGRFEWGVLTWNAPAREYYASIGAKPQERFLLNRMEGPALEDLARKF
jgi:GNAT superfamily N-acetyltransferase